MADIKRVEITPQEIATVIPAGAPYVTGNLFGDDREEIVFVTETKEGNFLHLAHRPIVAKRGFLIHRVQELQNCEELDSLSISDKNNDKQNELKIVCKQGKITSTVWLNRDQILEKLFPNRPDIQKRFR